MIYQNQLVDYMLTEYEEIFGKWNAFKVHRLWFGLEHRTFWHEKGAWDVVNLAHTNIFWKLTC